MKRIFAFCLLVTLVFMISNCVLAEDIRANYDIDPTNWDSEPNFFGAFIPGLINLDNWYTIEENPMNVSVMLIEGLNFNGGYVWNDQTYAKLDFTYFGSGFYSIANASYLTKFGLFAGVTALSEYDSGFDCFLLISPGYRLNLGKNGYAAVRVDMSLLEPEIIDYFVSGKYLTDKLSLKGKLAIFPGNVENSAFKLDANYKIFDSTVVGLKVLGLYDETAFEIGATCKAIPNLTVDGNLGVDISNEFYYSLNGMYRLVAGWGVGAEYDSLGLVLLKTKYSFNNSELGFITNLPVNEDSGFLAFNLFYKANL